ncbi:MAG: calcineurin-like phosphoesterase C-terminal domain-containing protein [Alistipes sp.]|nr:calcineurin-like phosphoesterase C-terminal domain-containing protein [Candidatus Alistipes equi]
MKRLFAVSLLLMLLFTVEAQMRISGRITDTKGNGIANVAVSDGYSIVLTTRNGSFKMKTHRDAYYVFYSIPSQYKINVKDGHPHFYEKLDENKHRYDFTLESLEEDETTFRLVMLADPQVQSMFQLKRFERETIPDIKSYVDASGVKCYGITLGDMGYSEGKHNATGLLGPMRDAMRQEKSHLLFFQTIGNHDNAFAPVEIDAHSSTFNIAYQRPFEKVFGPVNYSWNRGNVHIISMKNVQYESATSSGKYKPAFTEEQFRWLEKDLSLVPKDRLVLLCLHVGIYSRQNPFLEETRKLLSTFNEAHLMIGHTHFMNHSVNKFGTYEHVHAAASGAYWLSCVNGDGTPNGYTIYEIKNNHISNWWYKGVGHDISYQIRLYRGDAQFGGEYEKFQFPYTHDTVLANVFMADPGWKVELYEDGVLSGEMERIPVTKDSRPEVNSSRDWWAVGYHIGVIGRSYGKVTTGHSGLKGGGRKGYLTTCNHMYRLQLKNPNTKQIKVVARDTNGNVYEQTKFTESGDYSENELINKIYHHTRKWLDKNY